MPAARNKWDADQRRTLVILHTNFPGLSIKQRVAIFNVYHRDHLLTRGLRNGLGVKAFKEQYGERDKKPQNWGPACAPPSNDREWQRQHEIIQEIRTIAAALKIGETETPSLRPTATSQVSVVSCAKEPRRKVIRTQRCRVAVSSEQPSTEAADETEILQPLVTPASSCRKSAIARRKQRHDAAERSPVSTARKAGMEHPMLPPHTSIPPRPLTDKSATKMPLVRNNGPVVFLSPEKHATARQELSPVLPHEAHNPPSGLLFRYFDNSTSHLGARANGVLEGRGFRATTFSFNNCRLPDPPASVSDRLFADIENHINRNQVASPFISTTDRLIWLLSRIALRELHNGKLNGYISIIDSKALEREAIYHPKTFCARLKAAYVFTEGAWHYSGRNEYLVWAEIPQHAVVNTFSVRQLVELVDGISGLRISLRFDKISRRMCSLDRVVLSELRKDDFELTEGTIIGFGKLCAFLGLSDPCHVQSLVTSLVFGWCFHIRAQTPEMWAKDAALFAEAFLAGSNKAVFRLEYLEQLKLAYLSGVREGYKGTFNMLHEPQRQQNVNRMERTAAEIGLTSPAEIMLNELLTARRAIQQYADGDRARFALPAPLATPTTSRAMLQTPGTSQTGGVGDDYDMVDDVDDNDDDLVDAVIYENDDDSSSDFEDIDALL
ncbi:hypothetical protein KC332_g15203 [Hortaea werneckii]|uniref:DUF7587 domain-containing protein n=1 Tax=Hortaea werneckii EXF-2000 TaxID=1157616 RepID=A0A1Z5TKY5_HORWE|nr:hypothetical protein KC350_g14935 [Hortaea werneckii]OTA36619.1 hypothetical protein BTJ68_02858 [Hortaea werneckii EXF-2000]KAI6813092.1 hypothetical protein KC358_g11583 [Hortaea werneckii]KAI6915904.1 hypothetical protein KC348_g11800 [Hortaea werneckii]KAI6928811.1 hypothetical protein KC341_g11271 [Hortaea werneckii]